MVTPGGRPVALEKTYPVPVPPVATSCVGVIATPCTAVMATQLAVIGGGVQVNDPLSLAIRPPSAVACANGFGCEVQASFGVVFGLVTVTVTLPCAGIEPRAHVNCEPPAIEQVPCDADAAVQVSPPLVGKLSVSVTLVASLLPVGAGLLTTIW